MLDESFMDKDGKLIFFQLQLNYKKALCCGLYAPNNPKERSLFYQLYEELSIWITLQPSYLETLMEFACPT